MGGGSYDRDVYSGGSSDSFSSAGTSSKAAKQALGARGASPDLSPKDRKITSERKQPVVVALDVTGSNIEFARVVYDKAPMLHGQIEQQGYLDDFDICFAAVGDAHTDSAPLQVGDFAFGIGLEPWLKKLWLESGGGGQQMESYELAAHFFAGQCSMPKAETPFFFMIADEAPYPLLDRAQCSTLLGRRLAADLDAAAVFKKLLKKFKGNVFILLNPYCGHAGPETEEIYKKWLGVMGAENQEKLVRIREEKGIIDLILGIIAMCSKSRNLDGYLSDMTSRGQTAQRVKNVRSSLVPLEQALVPVEKQLPAAAPSGQRRKSGGTRIG